MRVSIVILALLTLLAGHPASAASTKPNILLILADDLGYGDVRSYNAQSKVATPNLDRLAREGMRFTDAHSPATVCTPTRYSLLTGQMAFRVPNGDRVFAGTGGPSLIAPGRLTLPGMLRANGYATACVGKWHVGLTFSDKDGQPVRGNGVEAVRRVDFSRRIEGGPVDHGFDHFFGTACCPTTDWLYAFIENDRVPVPPTALGKSLLREILETVLLTALIYVIVNAATGRFRIEGSSMEPSMHNEQYVLVDKVSYQISQPQRGDVIVFNYPKATERDFIKRIIGLPGETVHVTGGVVYVNNVPLNEPYISAPPNYESELTLGPDEYYVLGDNRNSSSDTHIWGPLEYKYFVGRAVLVYWPPESWGLVPHYPYPDILPQPTASP